MKNISLLFHGIYDGDTEPVINPSLFVSAKEIEELVIELKNRGYKFVDSSEIHEGRGRCSISFDDGYFNNSLFFPIAEKYQVPFLIFLSSLYVVLESPFVWDLCGEANTEWQAMSGDVVSTIEKLLPKTKIRSNHHYRPFTLRELEEFDRSNWVRWANHTHSHQPWIGRSNSFFENERGTCENMFSFLSQYSTDDFAFPNGLYDRKAMKWAKKSFSRVHTINAGAASKTNGVVDRISLVSPKLGLGLIEQVEKQSSALGFFKRKYVLSKFRARNSLKSLF